MTPAACNFLKKLLPVVLVCLERERGGGGGEGGGASNKQGDALLVWVAFSCLDLSYNGVEFKL